MNKPQIILVGGGGHCKSCIDVIEMEDRYEIAGIIDLPEKVGNRVFNYEIIGTDKDLYELRKKYDNFLVTLGHIKTPDLRIKLFEKIKSIGGKFPVIKSPRAYVSKYAKVEEGSIVMHDAMVNAAATIGRNSIVNSKALIEHDAVIEAHCHIATGAIINGGSRIGEGTFVGSNTLIRESIDIGNRCVIGGGEKVMRALSSSRILKGL